MKSLLSCPGETYLGAFSFCQPFIVCELRPRVAHWVVGGWRSCMWHCRAPSPSMPNCGDMQKCKRKRVRDWRATSRWDGRLPDRRAFKQFQTICVGSVPKWRTRTAMPIHYRSTCSKHRERLVKVVSETRLRAPTWMVRESAATHA